MLFGTNNGIAGQVLLQGGTDEQRKSWLPRLASGEVTASFGLTEADAGSDPSTLATRARRDGGAEYTAAAGPRQREPCGDEPAEELG